VPAAGTSVARTLRSPSVSSAASRWRSTRNQITLSALSASSRSRLMRSFATRRPATRSRYSLSPLMTVLP
jgi:hypothetical protein